MSKDTEKKEIAPRSSSVALTQSNGHGNEPWQLDPELANIAIAKALIEKMGTPSRINQVFNARKALLLALNHREPEWDKEKLVLANDEVDRRVNEFRKTPECVFSEIPARDLWISTHQLEYESIMSAACVDLGNPTGYDCSLRLAAYENWERGSVNEGGVYFDRVWAFLMKPKVIINGMAGMPGVQQEEEKGESGWSKLTGLFRRKKTDDSSQQ